jgi:hypothetical protein|tara:strand:+ start:6005 stop:6637 length:633 start_codon:yes stop_codon:yes gene_type:complete
MRLIILNKKLDSLIKKKIKSAKTSKIKKGNSFKLYEGEVKNNKPNGWGRMVLTDNTEIFGNFENGKMNGFGIAENKGFIKEIGFFKDNRLIGETLKIYMNKKNQKLNYEPYIGELNSKGYALKGTSIFMKYFVCTGNWNYGFAHGECIINLLGEGVIRGIWKYGRLIKKLNEFGNTSRIDIYRILSENMSWNEEIDSQKKVISLIKDISK